MLDRLFSPFTLKTVELRNRMVVPGMVCNYCGEDGNATERFIAYHEAKAKGGWGLIITEDYAIARSSRAFKNVAGLWEDGQIASHARLVERVHAAGAKIFAQIYHCGRQSTAAVLGMPPLSFSAIADNNSREVPRELDIPEIEELVGLFGDAVSRAKQAGFDGVEIHGGHGYLIAQSLSPYSNKRTDRYGGNLPNRMRFALEVIRNARARVGAYYVVGFRISGDELMPGGRTFEDTLTMLPYLEEAGVDYFNVSAGVGGTHGVVPPAPIPHAWLAEQAGRAKRAVSVPIMAVGRMNDVFLANQVLASGRADLVAMGRASLVDPETPDKAREGKFEDIRVCIGCNEGCHFTLWKGEPITCVLNPALGRESEPLPEKAARPKKVAVIGAGPAGMEAARTAAMPGHEVTVYEKAGKVGGQFRLAAVPPCKGEIAAFINWQTTQLEKLGVAIRLETAVDADFLRKNPADAVVVATGSRPILPPIPGIESDMVVTAHDLLAGRRLAGQDVVVVGGGQVGAETAYYLALQRRTVTLVEMLPGIAMDQEKNNRMFLIRGLKEWGVRIMTGTRVLGIHNDSVAVLREDGAEGRKEDIKADTVVVAVGSRSENALAGELANAGFAVEVVGDAAAVGQVMGAVRAGYEAGMRL